MIRTNRIIPTTSEIEEQLKIILASPEFHASERQANILSHVVLETLAGREKEIRGYTIATQVLGRAQSFDPSTDPIVSMHANKLRKALERYYFVAGTNDKVRIDIPKGSYVPVFVFQDVHEQYREISQKIYNPPESAQWPQISIQPFRNLSGEHDIDVICSAICSEIVVEIGYSREITPHLIEPAEIEAGPPTENYFLSGTIYTDSDSVQISLYLKAPRTKAQILGQTFHLPLKEARIIAKQKEVAGKIAAIVAGENGALIKHLIQNLHTEKIEDHTPHEAVLRYYIFSQDSTQENAKIALAALLHATETAPHIGMTWSFLARLYIELLSFGAPGFEQFAKQARFAAEKGVSLDPHNQRSLLVLAFILFLVDDLESARHYLQRILETFPGSILYLDLLGYLLTLSGQWEQGVELCHRAIRINPYYSPIVHYALWLNAIRQQNYRQAYIEANCIIRPSIFWYHLVFAITLEKQGKHHEGKQYIDEMLGLFPDFTNNGRKLIEYYIKSEKLRVAVLQGLERYGLTLH